MFLFGKKMIAINLAIIFFIGLDRFFKALVLSNRAGEFKLLGEILKFSYRSNYNIAFSLPLAGRWLIAVISFIILLLIFYLVQALRGREGRIAIYLFFIIMGAASNLFDRLRYGFVIDYLDLKYFTVFNLADVAIIAGVFLIILSFYKNEAV